MRIFVRTCLAGAAALVMAGAAEAACTASADPQAAVRRLDASNQADANLIVGMTMMPKLMQIDYGAASRKAGCSLGALPGGDGSYKLWAEDKGGRQRKALSATKGAPAALVIGVFDLMKQLTKPSGSSATIEGYMLATVDRTSLTAWRYYSGMPDAETLKTDMAAALAGQIPSPIFRSGADGQVTLFVPGK